MPAAAVIPASVASIKVVAVERFAVECLISYDHQYIRILATALVNTVVVVVSLRCGSSCNISVRAEEPL